MSYEANLEHCAGYVHFSSSDGPIEAILFLHGNGEAAKAPRARDGKNGKWQGPAGLLRHPLPAYFYPPDANDLYELDDTWKQGNPEQDVPSPDVRQQWQQHYELFAPQKKEAGPWTEEELEEVRDKVLSPLLPQRRKWHLAGTSFGGAGALWLVKLCQTGHLAGAHIEFLSLGLACPKSYLSARGAKLSFLETGNESMSKASFVNLPGNLPPVWTCYGEQDHEDVIKLCNKIVPRGAEAAIDKANTNEAQRVAKRMDGKKHGYVCRHAYEDEYFKWLGAHQSQEAR